MYLLDLFEGRRGSAIYWVGAFLGDWSNGGNVDVLFTFGESGVSSFGK